MGRAVSLGAHSRGARGHFWPAPIVEGPRARWPPRRSMPSGIVLGCAACAPPISRSCQYVANNIRAGGTLEGLDAGAGVSIGRRLADPDQLSLRVGDPDVTRWLLPRRARSRRWATTPAHQGAPYKGCSRFGSRACRIRLRLVFMPLAEAQGPIQTAPGDVTAIEVYVEEGPDQTKPLPQAQSPKRPPPRPIFMIAGRPKAQLHLLQNAAGQGGGQRECF